MIIVILFDKKNLNGIQTLKYNELQSFQPLDDC